MKLKLVDCTLYGVPENDADLQSLLMRSGAYKEEKSKVTEPKTKKYKTARNSYRKTCDICDGKYSGMTIHKRMAHDDNWRKFRSDKMASERKDRPLAFKAQKENN